jgi:hypothetical protein
MSTAGLGPEVDCAGKDQQQLKMTDQSSRQRRCYIRIKIASVQLKKILVVNLKGLGAKMN